MVYMTHLSGKHNNLMTFPPQMLTLHINLYLSFDESSENKGTEITMLHLRRRSLSLITLPFISLLSSLIIKSEGANHIVGDSSGWELLTNFTNWTQGREFHVGDVLVFNYNKDEHNVMQVNSTAYADCGRDDYISLFTKGNDSVIISEAGEHWFICGVDDHCENGQKLNIDVAP